MRITRQTAYAALLEMASRLENRTEGRAVTAAVNHYTAGAEEHPYFPEMKDAVRVAALEFAGPGFRGLEIGAGGGNLTEALAGGGRFEPLPFSTLVVSDLDEECHYVANLQTRFGNVANLSVQRRDLREPQPERDMDAIFSCAVDHHIAFEDKPTFFRNILQMLRPGGVYISADVLVTPYKPGSAEDRLQSVTFYHAVIVDEALRAGLVRPAEISFAAWKNEIVSQEEYKVSPQDYRRLIKEAGFKVARMEKIGPQGEHEHGIYVSVLQRPYQRLSLI